MSIGSGAKTAIGEAASWMIAGLMVVGTVIYFDELKALVAHTGGLKMPVAQHQSGSRPARLESQPRHSANAQIEALQTSSGNIVKLAAGPYGHYKTFARINGREIKVLVDTGASYVGLTYEDAERAGIFVGPSDFIHQTRTANGIARVAVVDIDRVSIGGIEVHNVRATVAERGNLGVTLLGMSFLSKLRRAEMRSGNLILEN